MTDRWILLGVLGLAVVTLGCLGATGGDGDAQDAEPTAQEDSPEGDPGEVEDGERSPANATSKAQGNGTADPRGPLVHRLNGTLTAEAANAGLGEAKRLLDVPVPSQAEAIVAELRWEGTADIDLALWSPRFCEEGTAPEPATGGVCTMAFLATGEADHAYGTDRADPALQDQAVEVRVDRSTIEADSCEEAECTWRAHVSPNLAVDAAFELAVSVFPDRAPEDGYSAFGED